MECIEESDQVWDLCGLTYYLYINLHQSDLFITCLYTVEHCAECGHHGVWQNRGWWEGCRGDMFSGGDPGPSVERWLWWGHWGIWGEVQGTSTEEGKH